MTRSRKAVAGFKGEITAFVALVFVLMISVVGALIQSASIQIKRSDMRAATDLALESTFAEYHQELLKQYELFARFGCSEEIISNRLQYYGATDVEHGLIKWELLTDDSGSPFYRQAVRYMKNWLGIEYMEDLSYDMSSDNQIEEKETEISKTLQSLLQEQEAELPTEDNPLETVPKLEESGLLNILVSNPEELSNRNVELAALPSGRTLAKGNYGSRADSSASDKLFFVAYITEHFSNMSQNEESRTLLYEQEYLLGGHASDKMNLEAVCKKILLIRMVTNYAYLQSSDARKGEAELLAATICSLLTVPEITEVVKQALLLAWAYGESIVDVRVLLKQEKVPLVKTDETWQLQLENLIKLGTAEEVTEEKAVEQGLCYEDYLKGLLLLESKETLSMRSLDLIESNLHIKTDQCMTKAVVESKGQLGLGMQETFTTTFGYQ